MYQTRAVLPNSSSNRRIGRSEKLGLTYCIHQEVFLGKNRESSMGFKLT